MAESDAFAFGSINFPEELIREFYRASAVGGLIAREEGDADQIIEKAFEIADRAMKHRESVED